MYLPLVKPNWLIIVIIFIIKASVLVKTLVKILKMQFSKLIGLNFFMEEAASSSGFKVRTTKFNLQNLIKPKNFDKRGKGTHHGQEPLLHKSQKIAVLTSSSVKGASGAAFYSGEIFS
jgi:hypothetical protein